MTHEPECTPMVRRMATNVTTHADVCVTCGALRAAYRRGYNDHARSQQHWQDTHGAYRQQPCEHVWHTFRSSLTETYEKCLACGRMKENV
jgi:hypothetical protein